jgi:hypothetical protein
MAYDRYKRMVGHISNKILKDMIHYSEELSDDQKNQLYTQISKYEGRK